MDSAEVPELPAQGDGTSVLEGGEDAEGDDDTHKSCCCDYDIRGCLVNGNWRTGNYGKVRVKGCQKQWGLCLTGYKWKFPKDKLTGGSCSGTLNGMWLDDVNSRFFKNYKKTTKWCEKPQEAR